MFTLKSVQDDVTKIKASKDKRLKIQDKRRKASKRVFIKLKIFKSYNNTLPKATLHTSRGRVHISENSFQDFKEKTSRFED